MVVRVPSTLRAATWKLALLLPLFALNLWMALPDLSWQRGLQREWPAFLILSLFLLLVRFWIQRGVAIGAESLRVLFAVWLIVNFVGGIILGLPKLAILAIFYGPLFLLLWRELERTCGQSAFDPQLKWYQGQPHSIPDLRAHLIVQGVAQICRVSRFDREGVFLFTLDLSADWLGQAATQNRVQIEILFRDEVLSLSGQPIRIWTRSRAGSSSQGMGLAFIDLSSDLRKQLGDWVEKLRGEGYVSE